ncbi:MAG: hypothetical protein AAGB19_17865 [Cyanobacteria bacterium P01_F01_bin.3]
MPTLLLRQIQSGCTAAFAQGYRASLRLDASQQGDRLAQLIVTAIEDGYTSGVEALLSYAMDDEAIYGRFRDGAQTFGYTLKDNEISYWLLEGAERSDSLWQLPVWRVDRDAPKKGRKCVKGIKCGLSCINSRRTCRIEPGPQAKQAIAEAKRSIKGATKPTGKRKAATKALPKTAVSDHRPRMSDAEAKEYTKNSVYSDKVFYHATNQAGARSISTDGIDPKRNKTGLYGQGFYVGGGKDGRDVAEFYGRLLTSSDQMLKIRLNVKKPKVFKSTSDYMSFTDANERQIRRTKVPGVRRPNEGQKVAQFIQNQGFDAMEISKAGEFIVYKPEQVVVVGQERF